MSNLVFGLQITAIGMGLVFGLLALLWGLLALAARFEPAAPSGTAELTVPTPPTVRVEGPGAAELEPAALAAISAAVLAHAANRRRQAAPETRSYWPGSLLFASRWVAAGRARQTRGYQRGRR
ncbi:MAG: sodium pump decarboxylase subunit gamma [Oscillochloris sp.]|nr:sodium pump decarboxylase subunit gamma [Oscillochloris sp.]